MLPCTFWEKQQGMLCVCLCGCADLTYVETEHMYEGTYVCISYVIEIVCIYVHVYTYKHIQTYTYVQFLKLPSSN